MKSYIFFCFLGGLLLTACCKPATPYFTMAIDDAAGNDLLAGEVETDSTWALVEVPDVPTGQALEIVNMDGGNALTLDGFLIVSGQDYYLRLNPNDVDTFNVVFETKGRCDLKVEIDQLTYNGNVFNGNDESHVTVVKY